MEQAITYQRSGKVAFKALGILVLLSFLLFNPIVLHHRFWDIARVLRSILIGSAQLAVGIGLVAATRWAAIAVSVLGIYVAVAIPSEYSMALRVFALMPAILTIAFWGSLDRSFTRTDIVWIGLSVSVSGFVEYVAFLRR